MLERAAKELLFQLLEVVDQCRNQDYSKPLEELGGATLGQHIRHTLEFFICLSQGADHQRINYDKRKHDAIIEADKGAAGKVIDELLAFFEKELTDFPLVLEANYSQSSEDNTRLRSSFFRELAYTVEHAIHHMALMAVAVRVSFPYIQLPRSFGVASSTIRYRQKRVQQ